MGRRPISRGKKEKECAHCDFRETLMAYGSHDRFCKKRQDYEEAVRKKKYDKMKFNKVKIEMKQKGLRMGKGMEVDHDVVALRSGVDGEVVNISVAVLVQQSERARRILRGDRPLVELVVPTPRRMLDKIRCYCYFFDYRLEFDDAETNSSYEGDFMGSFVGKCDQFAFQVACVALNLEIQPLLDYIVNRFRPMTDNKTMMEMREYFGLPMLGELTVEQAGVMRLVGHGVVS